MKFLEENLKLQIELISWDFTDSLFGKLSTENSSALSALQIYSLPIEWTIQLIQSEFLSPLGHCFKRLQAFTTVASLSETSSSCRLEIMNLLSMIPSIDYNAKTPPLSQNDYSASFGANVIEMANSVILMSELYSTSIPVSLYSKDYEEGGAKSDDLQLYCNVIQRLHCNIKLETLLHIPKYEETLHHIGVTTCMMSTELSQLADSLYSLARTTVTQAANPSTVLLFFQKHDLRVLNTWRRDVLFTCIHFWSVILDNSIMCDVVGGAFSNNNQTSGLFIYSKIFVEWLQSSMKTTFEQLFHCIMCAYLFDLMASDEQEEDQDEEAIDSRDVDDLLSSFCCIGRVCFPSATGVVSTYLNNSIRQASEMVTQQPLEIQSQQWHKSCLEVLERVRIGIITLSHLCFDNFQEISLLDGVSGETAAVNGLILAHLRCDPSCFLLDDLLMTILSVLLISLYLSLNFTQQVISWMQ